ncbi:thiol reductant ABC exporter subunit CydD [Neobacillus cucumis]|uniref:thiol reductant ABC exporter subunit CydD n=1 Tax=Neobacillus cucumis TaxID=1740721 RepID=UPI002E1F5DCA|nr:thiol reductant ABC exporter subunit CydD [Neobacillus cucumis]MED4226792.1 thiol reductant ABC exporter subunit CydD [Neobacillus cucumis]
MDKTLFSYKGVKLLLVKLTTLTLLQSIFIIIQAFMLAEAISSLFGGDLFRHVIKNLFIFLLALIFRHGSAMWKKSIAFEFAAETSESLREACLKKLLTLGPRFVRKEGSGQTVTLVMEGVLKYRRYLEIIFVKAINTVVIPSVILLVTFYKDSRSGIILLLALPILVVFLILVGLAAKNKADQQYESYHLLSNHYVDTLRGLETLKYLGLSQQHINKIILVSERYRRATISVLKMAFLSSFAMDFFTMLSIAMIAVFLGMGLINGTMDLYPALTILILAPEYFLPIRELGADYHGTLDGKNAGKKMDELLSQPNISQLQEMVSKLDTFKSLSLQNINVCFQDEQQAGLKNINFTVTGAMKIGIIGASGAGKSTLVDILSGFLVPSSGEFKLGEQSLTTLSVEEWQRQVSYIPQQPYLFHDTVQNNIRFYEPKASKEDAWKAAKNAGLLDVIEELPEKMNTMIGEGGRALSGGQEQRIAIARAFIGNRPIIILDEPTAHLDIETEAEIKETMLQLFSDKLVFFATHRLHWMKEMDNILVLHKGELVESGTHEQLMALQGTYYQLVRQQSEGI